MKYTKRDELLFWYTDIKVSIILGIILWASGVVFALNGYWIVLLIWGFLGIILFRELRKNYWIPHCKAQKRREEYMRKGTVCIGTIVDAGKTKEPQESNYAIRESNARQIMLKNYWVKVEYYHPFSKKNVVGTFEHMSKSGKRYIGRKVKVYAMEDAGVYIDGLSL